MARSNTAEKLRTQVSGIQHARLGSQTRQLLPGMPRDGSSRSPTPSASSSSDKENRSLRQATARSKMIATDKQRAEPPSARNRKRKLSERVPVSTGKADASRKEGPEEFQYYDPEQPEAERRKVRQEMRELARDLADSKHEFMRPDSNGLLETVDKANEIFKDVKQTSDATLDSRLLVTAGDMTARRALQNKLGDSKSRIEVDDFVLRCLAFMRRGPTEGEIHLVTSTQQPRRRRAPSIDEQEAEPEAENGDGCNWEWLGLKASLPGSMRPPVPTFLLGPLSVQKRVRKQSQRTQRLESRDPADALSHDELKLQEIDRAENANLTALCKNIYHLLGRTMTEGQTQVEQEIEALGGDDVSTDVKEKICYKHKITADGDVDFIRFVVNPRSFGQTVENIFYVSFLIRDGKVRLETDEAGFLTLTVAEPSSAESVREHNIVKKQTVFHLDFPTWERTVNVFDVRESIIPHRQTDNGQVQTWYG